MNPQPEGEPPASEVGLVRLALALGADRVGGRLSKAEVTIIRATRGEVAPAAVTVKSVRDSIRRGDDPLGEYLCRLRPRNIRRKIGAVYTPHELVRPMLDGVLAHKPTRLIDPGRGSSRDSPG